MASEAQESNLSLTVEDKKIICIMASILSISPNNRFSDAKKMVQEAVELYLTVKKL